jgi:nucleotide-binding universal stress UspA family protein
MILITCTIASFVAQKGAKNIALLETSDDDLETTGNQERILIPISNIETTDELINLSVTIKSRKNKSGLYALNIIDNNTADEAADKKARKLLAKAAVTASATDNHLHELLRYDLNIVNGISSVVKEHKITDLVLGLHDKKGISDTFLGHLTEGILTRCNATTLIYKPSQPLATIKRHLIIVPDKAEKEIGFPFWLSKIWNIARNTGATLVFYATPETLKYIREVQSKHPIECKLSEFTDWNEFLILSRDMDNDNLLIILSRKSGSSFNPNMNKIPSYLNQYFQSVSFILVYPMQAGIIYPSTIDLKNPSILEPIEKLDEIGKTIANLFRRNKGWKRN